MTGERRSWTAALCCCMGWALTAAPAVAAPASLTLDVPDLGEPVGIAADLSEGRYWVTDGTTSGRTTVVSVGDDGKLGTKLNWQAPTTDVQALSWYDEHLYVGDIGDSARRRDHIQVLSPMSLNGGSASWMAWDFSYPDGPHDAAAMAVSPRGNMYFITRGDKPAIYRTRSNPSRTGVNALIKVADAPAGVTDATFLADGSRIAMRTDNAIHVVDAYSWHTIGAANFTDGGGEAMTTDLRQANLELTTSATKVTTAQIPSKVEKIAAVPTASSDHTASQKPTAATEPNSSRSTSKRPVGTVAAIIGAVVLAVVAGVFVGLWGRREDA